MKKLLKQQKVARQLRSEAAKSTLVIADLFRNRKTIKQLSSRAAKKLSLKTVNNHLTVQLFNHSTARKTAFTLAEVLITLAIIGVVAALTIPTLITKYEKKQTVNKLKKAYSEISQAVQMAQVEHGLMETWDFANYPDALSRGTDFFENYLMPNVKVAKKCIPSNSECWADDIYTLDKVVTTNSLLQNSTGMRVSFVTISGYSVFGWLHGVGTGGWFWVDLNGPKGKPNQIGRDIFAFVINWKLGTNADKIGFFPAGLYAQNVTREDLISNQNEVFTNDDTVALCEKGKNHSMAGAYCTGVIVLDGWQIKDDYPW